MTIKVNLMTIILSLIKAQPGISIANKYQKVLKLLDLY